MSDVITFIAINAEAIIAVCALIVSVVSIFVAYMTLKSQNRHNKLSVKPIGRIGFHTDPGYLQIYVANDGVGPLLCEKLRIYKSENDIRHSFEDLLPVSPEQKQFITFNWSSRKNFAIPAGEKFILLDVRSKEEYSKEGNAVCDFIKESLNQITLEFKYRGCINKIIHFGECVNLRNINRIEAR